MVLTRNSGVLSQQLDPSQPSDQSHGEILHHGDFDAEQAEMLQDLARDGAGAPEAQMYSYPDTGVHGVHLNSYDDGSSDSIHSNGVVPAFDIAYNAAYTYHHAVPEEEDPVELLESLSNYEQSSTSNNVPISNDHFASLLRAAATAGGQDSLQGTPGSAVRPPRQYTRTAAQLELLQQPSEPARLTRKRLFEAAARDESTLVTSRITRRRQEQDEDDMDEEAQLRLENEIWGPEEEDEEENLFVGAMYESPPVGASDARALGVHSAAALFRRPSRASKKYTRPPMSKLFTSLELPPGLFLHLQAAAKTYMLDPMHPERSESVGNKGKSDTDMVKLKLFGCVSDFLEVEGWGEKCFGRNSERAQHRKLIWPDMKTKIISLVTPLLRRMVTNERQRQYALETRAKKSNSGAGRIVNIAQQPQSLDSTSHDKLQSQEAARESHDIDPKLNNYHYSLESAFSDPGEDISSTNKPHETNGRTSEERNGTVHEVTLRYNVNIIQEGKRVLPKLELNATSCPGFLDLVQHILNLFSDHGQQYQTNGIRVLGANGLVKIEDDESWMAAVKEVEENEWMEGDVKIVVDLASQQDPETT